MFAVLQDWTTLEGLTSGTITQSSATWVDLSAYVDIGLCKIPSSSLRAEKARACPSDAREYGAVVRQVGPVARCSAGTDP